METAAPPPPLGTDKPVSPKIDKIANDITALNLLEVAELSDLLKKRLNLPDTPIMPIGGFAASAPAVTVNYYNKIIPYISMDLIKFNYYWLYYISF